MSEEDLLKEDTKDQNGSGSKKDAETQTMWVFQSLRDALANFAEENFSELMSENEDDDDDDDDGLEEREESDNEHKDNEELEAVGRLPTFAELQRTLRNASHFLTPPPSDQSIVVGPAQAVLTTKSVDPMAPLEPMEPMEPMEPIEPEEREQREQPENLKEAKDRTLAADADPSLLPLDALEKRRRVRSRSSVSNIIARDSIPSPADGVDEPVHAADLDIEAVGRFPTLQELQAKLKLASSYFPSGASSRLQQYSLLSLDNYQLPRPLETFQKMWANPPGTQTSRELLAKLTPVWSPNWPPNWPANWPASLNIGESTGKTIDVTVDESETTSDPAIDDFVLSPEEKEKSYGSDGGLGCEHYLRNCKVQCPDCSKFYPCRLCHDSHETHELRRKAVCNMLCMLCLTPQPAAEYCVHCNELMADYYCDICRMWSDDPDRPIFHCEECGICRVGQGLGVDVFHCSKCGICMDLALENNHQCIVTKGPQSDCPICLEDLFNSTVPIVIMPCGHPIHHHCFEEYTKRYYRCPICSRSVLNTSAIFRLLDEEINQEVLPPELENSQVEIHCHDCGMRTRTPFHLAGLKCTTCSSYNTTRI